MQKYMWIRAEIHLKQDNRIIVYNCGLPVQGGRGRPRSYAFDGAGLPGSAILLCRTQGPGDFRAFAAEPGPRAKPGAPARCIIDTHLCYLIMTI